MECVGKTALIVEGGAMRSVFSCGVLDHFMAMDFSPFDSFWGVSAGASNLAAYLAKMPLRNKRIYLDYSLRKEFVSLSRFLRGGDMIDLDWMWEITLKELGIDKQTFDNDTRPFFLVVTNSATGRPEYLTPDSELLAETMKASSALPILYRRGVELSNGHFVDGGVSDSIPIEEAIRRGASKIMIIRSRDKSYKKSKPKLGASYPLFLKKTPALIIPMQTIYERYNQTLELIEHPPEGVQIVEVCPPDGFSLSRLTQSKDELKKAYQLGVEAGKHAIQNWHKEGE